MFLSDLSSKRLILISGKGGVGKTTVAVSLALKAAAQKKNVLLVELNSAERIAPFFNLTTIGQKEVPLAPFITGVNLSPKQCFEEYVLKQVKFKAIYDTFFSNRFVTAFLDAVPGFNELLMVGKIYELEKQKNDNDQYLYDVIIVDAPASGHGASTFAVPQIASEAIKVGPLKTQSEAIKRLLQDETKTALCIVTLAEEMPVAECGELIATAHEKLSIELGPIFVNALMDNPFSKAEAEKIDKLFPEKDDPLHPYFAYSHFQHERAELNEFYFSKLKNAYPGESFVALPYLYHPLTQAQDFDRLINEITE